MEQTTKAMRINVIYGDRFSKVEGTVDVKEGTDISGLVKQMKGTKALKAIGIRGIPESYSYIQVNERDPVKEGETYYVLNAYRVDEKGKLR